MNSVLKCRRTFTALYTITLMAALGAYLRVDLSGAMGLVAIALTGGNAAQAIMTARAGKESK